MIIKTFKVSLAIIKSRKMLRKKRCVRTAVFGLMSLAQFAWLRSRTHAPLVKAEDTWWASCAVITSNNNQQQRLGQARPDLEKEAKQIGHSVVMASSTSAWGRGRFALFMSSQQWTQFPTPLHRQRLISHYHSASVCVYGCVYPHNNEWHVEHINIVFSSSFLFFSKHHHQRESGRKRLGLNSC